MEALAFYQPATATNIVTLRLADAAPGSSDDIVLRVTNTSDLYQAEDVVVSVAGPDAVQLWLSGNGDDFAASLNVGDIAPGASSTVFWLRRVTDSKHVAGSCTAKLQATPRAWVNPIDTSSSTNLPLDTED